jgi:hypothetical protein
MAAIAASQQDTSVLLLDRAPLGHIGGMVTGGLGKTDAGNSSVIGGLARTFFNGICKAYHGSAKPSETCFEFEPHVAEEVMDAMLANSTVVLASGSECGITKFNVASPIVPNAWSGRADRLRGAWLDSWPRPAAKADTRTRTSTSTGNSTGTGAGTGNSTSTGTASQQKLLSVTVKGGTTFEGTAFIDGSYEGDLLLGSGVDTVWGREGQSAFNESMAGRLPMPDPFANPQNQFGVFVNATGPDGRALPLVWPGGIVASGLGDNRSMAYTYRLCFTQDAKNKVPIPTPPGGYDPSRWEVLRRYIAALPANQANDTSYYWGPSEIPNGKTDINNRGAVSTDYILGSWSYPTGTWAERDLIAMDHINYILGWLHFLRTDEAVPESVRAEFLSWGMAADEFADNPILANWPRQLYVRECVRMRGAFVFTQADRTTSLSKADTIAVGSYNIDVHNGQRFIGSESGRLVNEGNFDRWGPGRPDAAGSFEIPYSSLVPRKDALQPSNVLSPVCASATHVGYGALRLEPQYMGMGEAAGIAAALAVQANVAVQAVDIGALQAQLVQRGQIIHR